MTRGFIAGTPVPMVPRKETTFQELWDMLALRRRIILAWLLSTIAVGAVLFAFATRLYQGSAEIQVQKESADALSMGTMMGPEPQLDAIESNINLQTQAQILQSETLALQVIKELNLEQSPDFRVHFSPIGWVLKLFAPSGIADPKNAPLENSPGRRARVIKIFESHLKVKPVAGTRLIDIQYLSRDPATAAAVVNRLVADLMDYNFQTRHNATREAGAWLGKELADLRKESEDLQAKVVVLQRDSDVFAFGPTDSHGNQIAFTPAMDQLQQATEQLDQAQSARIMKGALYQVVKDGDPELISGLAGNGMLMGASTGLQGSLAFLQNLRAEEAQTQASVNELSTKFGPAYPKLAELQSKLASTQASIRAETARIAGRVRNDYTVAQHIEDNDRSVFLAEKHKAEALNDKAVEYQIASQEALRSRTLYDTLAGRLKEADVVAGLRSSNITLVDAARPQSLPAKPNTVLYAAVSLLAGLLLGIGAALFSDATDHRIQRLDDMELLFAEASIGLLPYHSATPERKRFAHLGVPGRLALALPGRGSDEFDMPNATVAVTQPRAPYTEAVRVLCTSLLQGANGGPCGQVILVTSSSAAEGKSMLSTNLAIVYAQRGKKVLLIDGDLRTPVQHQRLNLPSDQGLTSLLATAHPESASLPVQTPFPAISCLHVLPAGPLPDSPAELLASDAMANLVRLCRSDYDFVIIDGAPILPVTDSAVLSRLADLTLVVARQNETDRRSLERTCQILRSQGVRQIAMVLNGVNGSGDAQYGSYGYSQQTFAGSNLHA